MRKINLDPAPILVLGIGDSLMGDRGVGIHLLRECARAYAYRNSKLEFLEGGTQGLALAGQIADRNTLILLEAVSLGEEPGTIHHLWDEEVLELGGRTATSSEGNAIELLKTESLLGDFPEAIVLVGVEPTSIQAGPELSPVVKEVLPLAIELAMESLVDALVRLEGEPHRIIEVDDDLPGFSPALRPNPDASPVQFFHGAITHYPPCKLHRHSRHISWRQKPRNRSGSAIGYRRVRSK